MVSRSRSTFSGNAMTRFEVLNNVAHKDLRIATDFGPEYGDAIGMVAAFPTEFAELQREYPLFFRRDAKSGELQATVLLGFEQDENLFLQGRRWNASYLPGAIAKGPFLIGFQERQEEGELRQSPVIHVDLGHARVATGKGEPVFLEHGGQSPYLQRVVTVLSGINDGVVAGKAMYAALDALELVQPLKLDVRFDTELGVNLTGLWSIDRERLAALGTEQIASLHRAGWLEGAYLMLASLHNLRHLIAEKQRRLREAAGPRPAN
jgi:hypothetical protein